MAKLVLSRISWDGVYRCTAALRPGTPVVNNSAKS